MEFLTGQKFDKIKTCYFSPIFWGIADVRGGKNVFVGSIFEEEQLNYIVMHELTHLYYTKIVRKLNLPEAFKSPLMEGVDHILLFKSPINKLLNTKLKYEDIRFVKENREFMNKLENAWRKRKDFESFLKEAIKIQNKTKNIKIC